MNGRGQKANEERFYPGYPGTEDEKDHDLPERKAGPLHLM